MNNFNYFEDDGNLINSLREPEYFYRVDEFVSTAEKDPNIRRCFPSEPKEFKSKNLLKCKSEATDYYFDRLKGFTDGRAKYFLPFTSESKFIEGENAGFSITLSFIEYFSENEQDYFIIEGESEEILSEGREFEQSILREKGYIK